MSRREAIGVITLMQEDRFRLETLDGVGLLFTLSRSAKTPRDELVRIVGMRVPVRVRYEGEPDVGAVALRVDRATRRARG
jgi:hypothetical protein